MPWISLRTTPGPLAGDMFFSRSCSPQLEGFFFNESLLKDIYESLVYVYTLVYLSKEV